MLSLVLTTPRQSHGRAVVFAATLCEGEGAVHEESVGHPALHGVHFLVLTTPRQSRGRAVPSRPRGSDWVGSGSERATTRPAHVGMRKELLESV
jgi:hypothetical protein